MKLGFSCLVCLLLASWTKWENLIVSLQEASLSHGAKARPYRRTPYWPQAFRRGWCGWWLQAQTKLSSHTQSTSCLSLRSPSHEDSNSEDCVDSTWDAGWATCHSVFVHYVLFNYLLIKCILPWWNHNLQNRIAGLTKPRLENLIPVDHLRPSKASKARETQPPKSNVSANKGRKSSYPKSYARVERLSVSCITWR